MNIVTFFRCTRQKSHQNIKYFINSIWQIEMSFYVVFVLRQYYHFVNIANTNVTADETTSFKTNIYKRKKKLLLILKESFKHKWPFVMKMCRSFKYCKKWDKIYQCFKRLVFLWYDIISVSFFAVKPYYRIPYQLTNAWDTKYFMFLSDEVHYTTCNTMYRCTNTK